MVRLKNQPKLRTNLDTDFLNTIDGHTWQREYLNGTSNVASSPEMQKAFAVLDKWKELGDAE